MGRRRGAVGAVAAASLALAVAGCATGGLSPTQARGADPEGPFVPVNIFLNPGEHISNRHARLLDHLYNRLATGGEFVHTSRGIKQWPFALIVRYRFEERLTFWSTVGLILSSGTIGLIPAQMPMQYSLDAEVVIVGIPPRAFQVVEQGSRPFSIYELGDPDRAHREAIDRLVARLMDQLAENRALPRASELSPPPASSDNPGI